MPGCTNVAYHRTLLMLAARGKGSTEFAVVTCWDDMESIVAFAGHYPEHAVFSPSGEQF